MCVINLSYRKFYLLSHYNRLYNQKMILQSYSFKLFKEKMFNKCYDMLNKNLNFKINKIIIMFSDLVD